MGIVISREVARADMNDEFGVTVWQERKLLDLTVEQARDYASEIWKAALEADRIRMDDVHRSAGGFPYVLGSDKAEGSAQWTS